MRYRSWVVMSAAMFAWVCLIALSAGLTVEEPVRKGLEIHEWGVFGVNDDREVANADMRAEWAALPKFVFGQTTGRNLPINQPRTYEVLKPVVYIHSAQPLAMEIRVDFPGGAPAVWWPRTVYPAQELDGCPGDGKRKEAFRYLEWHVQVKEPPKGQKSNAQPLAVDKGHWIQALRAVKADDVFTVVHMYKGGRPPEVVPGALVQIQNGPQEDNPEAPCAALLYSRYDPAELREFREGPDHDCYRCVKLGAVSAPVRLRFLQYRPNKTPGPLSTPLAVEVRQRGFTGGIGGSSIFGTSFPFWSQRAIHA